MRSLRSPDALTARPLPQALAIQIVVESYMTIRPDLKEVEGLISRLLSIGEEYRTKDQWWSHLKNNEDWGRNIWSIDDGVKKAMIERIYCDGRDMELFLSEALCAINYDITTYPTLTSIIARFDNTWINQDLESVLVVAIEAHDSLELNCWAFSQMVTTYREQMALGDVVNQTLGLLKNSNLYKQENGIPMEKDTPNITIGDISNSNIAIQSDNASQSIEINNAVFDGLIEAIKSSDIENKEPLITSAEEMKAINSSGNSIAGSYKNFIAQAANHMTIIAPFIPALSALL